MLVDFSCICGLTNIDITFVLPKSLSCCSTFRISSLSSRSSFRACWMAMLLFSKFESQIFTCNIRLWDIMEWYSCESRCCREGRKLCTLRTGVAWGQSVTRGQDRQVRQVWWQCSERQSSSNNLPSPALFTRQNLHRGQQVQHYSWPHNFISLSLSKITGSIACIILIIKLDVVTRWRTDDWPVNERERN